MLFDEKFIASIDANPVVAIVDILMKMGQIYFTLIVVGYKDLHGLII